VPCGGGCIGAETADPEDVFTAPRPIVPLVVHIQTFGASHERALGPSRVTTEYNFVEPSSNTQRALSVTAQINRASDSQALNN
jgi:hypothetical protein